MPDDKKELENLEEDSYADLDSLSDFVEIDDLSSLEGIEEFADFVDVDHMEDALSEQDAMPNEIPLPESKETANEIPLPEQEEMTDPEPNGIVGEIPLPEQDVMPDEIPLPESNGTADEIPLPEQEEMTDPEPNGTADEIPLPEVDIVAVDDVSLDALDKFLEAGSADESENVLGSEDAVDGETDSDSLEASEDAVSEEMTSDLDLLAMTEEVENIEPLDTPSEGVAESAKEENNLDDMLNGLLDNLDMTGSIPEEAGTDVTLEEDVEEEMTDLFGLLDDSEESGTEEALDIGLPEYTAEQEPQEKSPGILKKLFGNIVTDEIAEAERQALEEEKEAASEKAEQDAKLREEKEAARAAKAEERAAAKAAKAEAKAAKKAEKAAAKEKKKAEAAEAEEQFEVTGKLNKVGVLIIVALTVIFLVIEIVGTNIHGISQTKKEANTYFNQGQYTQAYQEILGTKLKEKDPETYNKIKTVMQVQRAINAYNNYDEMNYSPDALNALLRGIQRYDANLEQAKELDVVADMDNCRAQIISLLQSEFGVSESDAYALLALDQEQYTTKVVQLATSR